MTSHDSDKPQSAKKVFVVPELHRLDIAGTHTGPVPDPLEFPMILEAS